MENNEVTLIVQVNGKKQAEIQVSADASRDAIELHALGAENVQKALDGRKPKKVVVVPGRLVNIVDKLFTDAPRRSGRRKLKDPGESD